MKNVNINVFVSVDLPVYMHCEFAMSIRSAACNESVEYRVDVPLASPNGNDLQLLRPILLLLSYILGPLQSVLAPASFSEAGALP